MSILVVLSCYIGAKIILFIMTQLSEVKTLLNQLYRHLL